MLGVVASTLPAPPRSLEAAAMRLPLSLRARRIACLVGILTLGFRGGPALAASAPSATIAPFTPHVGDTLRYALTNGDSYVMRVLKTRAEAGRTLALVEKTRSEASGASSERMTWVRTEQGMAMVLSTSDDSGMEQSPLICYVAKAAPKDMWTAQSGRYRDTEGDMTEYRIFARLEAIETVTVPAGTFAGCHRISYQATTREGDMNEATRMVLWFKPDLGIVKTRTVQGETVTETSLTGYQTASYGHGGVQP
jgi:hypothetical protein